MNERKSTGYLSQCFGKKSYDTKDQALRQMGYKNRKNRTIYRCPYCHKFHLGGGW